MKNYNQLQSIANSIKLVGCLCFIIVLTSCAPSTDTTTSTETPTNNSDRLTSLIKESNLEIAGLVVTADDSDPASPKLTITGLTNSASGDPVAATINIDQSQGITTVPASIAVTAPAPISPHEETTNLMVTFGSEPAVAYAVTTRITGAPVSSWMTSQSVNTYIKATFLDQTATIELDGNALSVSGLANRPRGGDESGGMIVFGPPSETFKGLPSGFTSTADSITFPNPQGTGAAESTPTPDRFTITETENTGNSQEYTINNITLAGLENFDPMSHIAITKVGENTPVTGLTITTDTAVSPPKITITGLTNEAGANTYTLAINEVPGFMIDNAPFTRTIAEPAEYASSNGMITGGTITVPSPSITFEITNFGASATEYELEVVFSGAPVDNWFTSADIDQYVTATFAGQTADIALNQANLSITGLINSDRSAPGSIRISGLPSGFTAMPNTITIPAPSAAGDQTVMPDPNTFTITDNNNSGNSKQYTIDNITLSVLERFNPATHIVIKDASDVTLSFTVVAGNNNMITITGLTNKKDADPSAPAPHDYTLTIDPVNSIFTIPSTEGSSITRTITEPSGLSPGYGTIAAVSGQTGTMSSTFSITNNIDSGSGGGGTTYMLQVYFGGTPVNDWFDDNAISTYVEATFPGQSPTINFSAPTFTIGGLTNSLIGSGMFGIKDLPSGFVADPATIAIPNPTGIAAQTITLSPNSFAIKEEPNADTSLRTPDNSNTYTIADVTFSARTKYFMPDTHIGITMGATDVKSDFTIAEDGNNKITITGTNKSGDNAYTLTINGVTDFFNTPNNTPITLNVTEPASYASAKGTFGGTAATSTNFEITNADESAATMYTVEVVFRGAPVEDWFVNANISDYIEVDFLGQTATIALDDSTSELAVTGLINSDANAGSGTIRIANLPIGFTVTPNNITLPYSAGTAQEVVTLNPNSFTITETGNTGNSKTYTIANITLASSTTVSGFDPEMHIVITKASESTPVTGLTYTTNTEDPVKITIAGLTNEAGANTYTLTISSVAGTFSTGSTAITRTIADPTSDFSPGAGVITGGGGQPSQFIITNTDSTTTTYELEVVFSGASVSDWFTGDLTSYVTASFAGQTADALTLSTGTPPTIVISHNNDSPNNFTNVPGGVLVLTTNSFPTGYTLNVSALDSSAIDGLAAVSAGSVGMITISETTTGVNNSMSYPVTITLSAYKSPIDLSMVTYAATSDLDESKAGARLETNAAGTNEIVISGFTNTAGTTGNGTVTFQMPTGYTLSDSSFTFNNPSGASATNTNIGTITVTNTFTGGDGVATNIEVPHQVTVQFSGVVGLKVAGGDAGSTEQTISSGGEITISTAACELLMVPTTITVLDSAGADISGSRISPSTPFPRYYDRDRDTLASDKYTVTRRLVLEDASGNILDSVFTIMMKFPACTSFPSGQTGDNEASAYQIDSAPRLDLLSYLINNGTISSSYHNKYYKIMSNIDMGLPGLPFSEMGSKIPSGDGSLGKGFIPVGQIGPTQFSGTFDCDDKIISNLYINRPRISEVGLLGTVRGITSVSGSLTTIKDCSLTDVKITGRANVGGLVGNGIMLIISDSHVTGNVTGIVSNVGALFGSVNSSRITDSYVTATISGNNDIGGLGGLGGAITISNCYSTGAVSGTGDNVGGLAGRVFRLSSTSVTASYSTSAVTGRNNVGGLVGDSSDSVTISNSYATGTVTGGNNIGGLIGNNSGSISNSYAIGRVSGSGVVGGLDGAGDANNVTASYWNTETSGQDSSPGGGTGRTTAQMRVSAPVLTGDDAVYVDWDTATWRFTTSQYPRLINVACANQQNPGGDQGTAPCSSPLQ